MKLFMIVIFSDICIILQCYHTLSELVEGVRIQG